MKGYGLESVCCVPLVTGNGKVGALYVGRATTVAFSDEDIALLGQTSAQIAIAAENARAYEELTKVNARLTDEKQYLERELDQQFADIVGKSRALRKTLTAVKTVAPTDSSVLILGETGTGKELIARAIHNLGPRRERPFVRMNAAAMPASLFESELFGHEKGAFTGAVASRTGRLELAHRGTLFLDEVGDIPLDVQPKLLRFCRSASSNALAALEPSAWTCGSSPRRTAISSALSRTDRSEAISTIVSMSFRSRFRRCANVSRTFPRLRTISSPSARGGWDDRLRPSLRR
jgi:transcriptional regulator with GAF, ATPase, and Fis domain